MWPCVNVVFPLLSSRCLSNYTLSSFTNMILFHCLFQKLEILWMCYVLNLKSVVSLFLAKFSSFNFTATVLVPLLMSSLWFTCPIICEFCDSPSIITYFTGRPSVTFVTVPWLYALDKWILWQVPEIWITFCTCVQIIESLLIPEGTVYSKDWSGPYGVEWRVGPIN